MFKKILILTCVFTFCLLSFTFSSYALNLDKMKVSFLNGDYKQAILEGEKALAAAEYSSQLDELYYLLGLSYLKDGNYLRASDIFEIILREFKATRFREEALLALGDICFLSGDYPKAQDYYKKIITDNLNSQWRFTVYYRISECGLKTGDTQQAKEYFSKLKESSPQSFEFISYKDLNVSCDIYYAIQVGSFSSKVNAQNFMQKLVQCGYPAYIEEAQAKESITYRVRIGKFKMRQEALNLENKLIQEGYPTKIYP